ncbi:MAG: hypothetical protein RMJ43_04090 [Chloroherpetonaceae bacterium]|nr:hypothetical protein [Chthonomonadaceae bacterium]MDW8206992.1 hypothetical protein [Chloroherpetonaceae bacterium]
MIRIGLPPPVLPRLRLHWHVTRISCARYSRLLAAVRPRTLEVWQAWRVYVVQRIMTTVTLRQYRQRRALAQLRTFETHYEELVDLLCWSAKDGVHTNRDARYTRVRAWMLRYYPRIQAHLRSYWASSDPSRDPFLGLFGVEHVDDVIYSIHGIEDMLRSRAALEAYRRDLEQG